MSSTPLMPDDRRSLTQRLTVMQYVVAVAFAALAIGFLDLSSRAAREVPRNGGGESSPQAAAAGPARASCSIAMAACSSTIRAAAISR
jgi:hypothetical protein